MIEDEIRNERQVLAGLVEPHRELYLSNAWFKAQVDVLVRWLPTIVEGFAAASREKSEETQRRFEEISNVRFPLAPLFLTPEQDLTKGIDAK